MFIPNEIKKIAELFNKSGFSLFVVGGSVRDFLLNKPQKDIDLATNATPDESVEVLKGHFELDLHGKSFAVVMVKINTMNEPIEIASFREDSSGRKPEVKVGVTIHDDVKRRDLTINALFFDISKNKIIDFIDGKKDIKEKTIRFVGDAKERISEDKLRVLRAIRFACTLGFSMHSSTIKALGVVKELEDVSPERIFSEVERTIKVAPSCFCDTLTNFPNIWNSMFKGVSKLPSITHINSNHELNFVQIFLNESESNMRKWCFPNRINGLIIFFNDLFSQTNLDNIQKIYKESKRLKLNKAEISDFCEKMNKQSKIIDVFIKFKPVANVEHLISLGFTKSDLGKKIKEIEQNEIKRIYEKS